MRLWLRTKSCIEAPPVANAGDPKKPWRNRRTRRPAKLSIKAVGTQSMTKIPNVTRYGIFLPMTGISLNGEKINGPIPSTLSRYLMITYMQAHKGQDQVMQSLRKLRIALQHQPRLAHKLRTQYKLRKCRDLISSR